MRRIGTQASRVRNECAICKTKTTCYFANQRTPVKHRYYWCADCVIDWIDGLKEKEDGLKNGISLPDVLDAPDSGTPRIDGDNGRAAAKSVGTKPASAKRPRGRRKKNNGGVK